MKKLFLAAGFLAVFLVSALADDNVRAVQTKLKQSGFYFGAVDGQPSSDLSAAITRYQIRNGLQITGKLDAETSKALGVRAEAASAASNPNAETWRRLRTEVPNESPKQALEPAADGSKMVLSPERLRNYVAAFVLAGLDPQIGAELEFFGDRVRYYNDGLVDRAKIRGDLQRYAARWPERRFWLAGDVQVDPQPDSTLRVTFPIRYELRNGAKHSAGKIRKTLVLEVVGNDLQIIGVDERKAG
ncbi:MAG TPA: peptidoglycan-binding domain-containing protein [Chthoniobacterales bacterium]